MKSFIIILLLIPSLLFGQKLDDTDKHVYAGMGISLSTGLVLNKITHKPLLSSLGGMAIGIGTGFAKEYIWDRKMGRGVFNKNDIKATAWGSVVGGFTFVFVINISEGIKNVREIRKEFNKK